MSCLTDRGGQGRWGFKVRPRRQPDAKRGGYDSRLSSVTFAVVRYGTRIMKPSGSINAPEPLRAVTCTLRVM